MISTIALAITLYSSSELDRDTIGCFLSLQEIKLEPMKMASPPVNRRSSIQPAKSTTEKPLTSIDGERVICKPKLAVPLTYRRTRLAAVRCNVVGACKNWQILFTEKLISSRVSVRYCSPPLYFDNLLHQSVLEVLLYVLTVFPT
jgi:hypothetical protein